MYSWLPRSSGKSIRPPETGVPDGCELRTEPQLSVRVECKLVSAGHLPKLSLIFLCFENSGLQ